MKNENIWVDKDGKEHKLCYMSNTYLLNIINYLENVIKREFSDFNQVVCATGYVYPIYSNMIEEALSRNFCENMKVTLQSKHDLLSSCGFNNLDFNDIRWLEEAELRQKTMKKIMSEKPTFKQKIKRQLDLD